jgi:hypothetical protein
MDAVSRVIHESEVADVSERNLRLKSLQLAIQAVEPGKPDEVLRIANTFLNFLIGIDSADGARRDDRAPCGPSAMRAD